ncbi:unnamed protein product, partial [marine sediment metagenome]
MSLFAVPKQTRMNPKVSFRLTPRTRILYAHADAEGPARMLARALTGTWNPGRDAKPPRLPVRAGT